MPSVKPLRSGHAIELVIKFRFELYSKKQLLSLKTINHVVCTGAGVKLGQMF